MPHIEHNKVKLMWLNVHYDFITWKGNSSKALKSGARKNEKQESTSGGRFFVSCFRLSERPTDGAVMGMDASKWLDVLFWLIGLEELISFRSIFSACRLFHRRFFLLSHHSTCEWGQIESSSWSFDEIQLERQCCAVSDSGHFFL